MSTRTRTLAPAPTTTAATGSPFPASPQARSRKVLTTPSDVVEPTEEMRQLARSAYVANTAKNKATREETKARETLLAKMTEAGVPGFSFQTRVTDEAGNVKTVGIDVLREPKQVITVDIPLLRRLVGEDVFMQIVSATKGDIEKQAGGVVATQVIGYTQSDEESIKVKAAK